VGLSPQTLTKIENTCSSTDPNNGNIPGILELLPAFRAGSASA